MSWEMTLVVRMMEWNEKNRATINYCDRTITMGEVIISFDN